MIGKKRWKKPRLKVFIVDSLKKIIKAESEPEKNHNLRKDVNREDFDGAEKSSIRILLLLPFVFYLSATIAFADVADTENGGSISGDVFGKNNRWYHLFLSISEVYSDNIFNTNENRESDFVTDIRPGIRVTIPESDQSAEKLITSSDIAGGRVFQRLNLTSSRRFKAYAEYAPQFHYYSQNKDENTVDQQVQGGLQFSLLDGLAFDVVDLYTETYDRSQADIVPQDDRYCSNLLTFTAAYPISERFNLRVDYANFHVTYFDGEKNGFRNRTDNAGTGYLFFKIKSKTAVYFKYQHTDIQYENTIDRDGDERDMLAGFTWDFSAKTNLNFQAGYGIRHYDEPSYDDGNSFICQLNTRYQFSDKTMLELMAYQQNGESPETIYEYTTTTGASIKVTQILRPKLTFEFDAAYNQFDYRAGNEKMEGISGRIDNYFLFSPSCSYSFRKWLSVSLTLAHHQRLSEIDEDSYLGSTVAFKLTGAI